MQQARLSGGTNYYAYGASNNRIYKKTVVGAARTHEVTLWGAFGERVGTYAVTETSVTKVRENFYFAGKLVATETSAGLRWILTDRLGSVRGVAATSNSLTETLDYYPYGEEKGSATAEDREKFATYHRDSDTGMDYAVNRYHQAGWGRFATADPHAASGRARATSSWNRYAYVLGDPVNHVDPTGLQENLSFCNIFPEEAICSDLPLRQDRDNGPPREEDRPRRLSGMEDARRVAAAYQRSVARGERNDCQAMADFAGFMAENAATLNDFFDMFKTFFPPNRGGWGPTDLQAPNRPSGYLPRYQNGYGNPSSSADPNADQGHHFGFFFVFGSTFAKGNEDAAAITIIGASIGLEIVGLFQGSGSIGDLNLGVAAGMIGFQFASTARGEGQDWRGIMVRASGEIRKLCQPNPARR